MSGGRVSEGIEDVDVLDLLSSLVDRSLVVSEPGGGTTRYRLLETVRQYGRELLHEASESEDRRNAHRDHFLAFAEQAEPKLIGSEQMQWFALLAEEFENLRAALEWSLGSQGSEEGPRLCCALTVFWWRQGHLHEGREWCRRALATPKGQQRTSLRAKVLNCAGLLAWFQGDYASSNTSYEESVQILRESGDREPLSQALFGLGIAAFGLDDYKASRVLLEESYAVAQERSDRWNLAGAGYILGLLTRIEGDYDGAIKSYKEAIAHYRALGDRMSMSYPLYDTGLACYYRGDIATAPAYLEESLAIRKETNDPWGIAESQYGLGLVAYGQKDFPLAKKYFVDTANLARQMGEKSRIASSLHWLGCIALARGETSTARTHHEESLAIFQELGDRWGLAHCFAGFAGLAAHEKDFERAARLWAIADRLRVEIGSPLPPVERDQRDLEIAAAREAFANDKAFDEAWAEGEAMALEQALELIQPDSTLG